MKKRFFKAAIFLLTFIFYSINPKTIFAETDYQCIGASVAKYMNQVVSGTLGQLKHIKLLSPAFNMTNPATFQIIQAMQQNNALWVYLEGYAGNAYNVSGKRVTQWVKEFYDQLPNEMPKNKPVMITETGKHDDTLTLQDLAQEMQKIKDGEDAGINYLGALLFNAFNTNDDPEFSKFKLTDDEIRFVCDGTCGIIGVNSAIYYPLGDGFYNHAKNLEMKITLAISNIDQSTTDDVLKAVEMGLTPIIRVGTRESSGPEAEDYAKYLIELDKKLPDGSTVYAIAGPNEPDLEYWASPGCRIDEPLGEFPCDKTDKNELHSLRPYGGNPCNNQAIDLALFCGNDFIVQDNFSIEREYPAGNVLNPSQTYEGQGINPFPEEGTPLACGYCDENRKCVKRNPPCEGGCTQDSDCQTPTPACTSNQDGETERCFFNVKRTKKIAIDFQNAYFPIMGYTEDNVVNRRQIDPSEKFDDPTKLNEYVSWYLNGVMGRAEYDAPRPDYSDEFERPATRGPEAIVNFSGPLRKLLSFESQIVRRINEIQKAVQDKRHNQIIGCLAKVSVFGKTLSSYPASCYYGSHFTIGGMTWKRIEEWNEKTPPLRRYFGNIFDYWQKLEEWREHASYGIFHEILNDLNQSFRNFDFIPFSSTEDRKGKAEISTYSVPPPTTGNARIIFNELKNQKPADLFFAHMQETKELSKLFQKIYTPYDLAKTGAAIDKPADPQIVPYQPFCDIYEIRSNPGDNLYPGEISAELNYLPQVSCDFTKPGDGRICRKKGGVCVSGDPKDYKCSKYYDQGDCNSGEFCGVDCKPKGQCGEGGAKCGYKGSGTPPLLLNCCPGFKCVDDPSDPDFKKCVWVGINQEPLSHKETCSVNILVPLQTITGTPLADEVWARLVAGPASVFRRIFPQIKNENGRPLKALWDIPGASPVTYITSGGVAYAGNPNSKRGDKAEIYFPHIGGIHEYFLRCIQKTLRPQGFAEGCSPVPESTINPPPGGPPGAAKCEKAPQESLCSVEEMKKAGWEGCAAEQASIICWGESGGNPEAFNNGCEKGTSLDYSVGLFQINLLAHCPGALDYTEDPISCTIRDPQKLNSCMNFFKDGENNKQYAFQLYSQRGWSPWGVYKKCQTYIDSLCPK